MGRVPLELIVGPANSAKAGVVLDGYRAAVARDPLLVVPTFGDVTHYRRELAEGGLVFAGEVMRFNHLMREVAKRAGYRARQVGWLQRQRLVAQAIEAADLRVLAESAAAPGFARAARTLIGELERALIEPPVFHTALKRWAAGDAGRLAYANEVAAVYTGYRAALERLDRVDTDLFAWRALDALRAEPGRWGDTPVFLYGFDDLTPLQRDAIETLSRVAGAEVTVSLTHEPGRRAFAARARTVEDLRPLATEVVELPARTEHYAPASRAVLSHLERELFEDDPTPIPPGRGLRLLEAGGERAEAELAAAEVLELLRSGVPADEIAVVVRSRRKRAPLLVQVFASYGIPTAAEWRVRVSHTSLGRGLLALLRCGLDTGTADDVLAYLRTPGYLRVPALADRLEFEARRTGAVGVDEAAALWEDIAKWPLDAIERVRAAVAADTRGPLLRLLADEARRLFERPHLGAAHTLDRDELVDARVLRELRRALDELIDLEAADPGSAPTAGALHDLLGELEVELGDPVRPGAVQIANPGQIRARRYRAVLVLGLQEGEFPERPRPEPFLPDQIRSEVIAASQLRLPPREDNLDAERYLFYACVSRPEETLILSRSTSNEEGTPTIPSFFLADVERLLDGKPEVRERPLAQITWPVDEAPTVAELERARAAAAPRVRPEPIQPLRDPAALEPLADRPLSAGALEAWLACPVKWLVEQRLRPERLEPDAVQLVRGSLSHLVLEETLRRLREETGSARVTPETLPQARHLVAGAIEARRGEVMLSPHEPTTRAELWRLEREICRYLAHEATTGSDWEPVHLELTFGLEGSGLPALELGGGELLVRGKIDRVDIDPTGRFAIVRDYKASKSYPVARWEPDGLLQVPLYMLAVEQLLDLRVVGGVYQALRGELRPRGMLLGEPGVPCLPEDAVVANDCVDPDSFRAELDRVAAKALEIARELRAGVLQPRPDTCHWRGDGCAHQGICRSVAA